MALEFNMPADLTLGGSAISPRDTYSRPIVDPNAGGQLKQLAESLAAFSGTVGSIEEDKIKKDAEDTKAWAITTAATLGAKVTPDAINNVLSPYHGLARTQHADSLGRIAGYNWAQEWQTTMTPADMATPEATTAFWNRGLIEGQKRYGTADKAFLPGFTETFYSTSNSYKSQADGVRTGQQLQNHVEDLTNGIMAPSTAYVPTRSYAPQDAQALIDTARRLNVPPQILALAMMYETNGEMKPNTKSLDPKSGRYGLLQIAPGSEEEKKYGFSPNQTFAQQLQSVEQYLLDRKFKGTNSAGDLEALYSTINSGSPGNLEFRDGSGLTVKDHIGKAKANWGKKTLDFLGIITPSPANKTPGKGTSLEWEKPWQAAGVQPEVIDKLKTASGILGSPIKIISGHRDAEYNASVGGAKKSAHITGKAVDVDLAGLDDAQRTQVVKALRAAGFTRFIGYTKHPDMLHADVSTQNGPLWAMWDKSNKNLGMAKQWFLDGVGGDVASVAGKQYASLDTGTMTDATDTGPAPTTPPAPGGTQVAQAAPDPNDPFGVSWDTLTTSHAFADRDAVVGATSYWLRPHTRNAAVDAVINKAQETLLNGGDMAQAEQYLTNTIPDDILTEEDRSKIIKARRDLVELSNSMAIAKARKEEDQAEQERLATFSEYGQLITASTDPSLPPEQRQAAMERLDPFKFAIDPKTGKFDQKRFEFAKSNKDNEPLPSNVSIINHDRLTEQILEYGVTNDPSEIIANDPKLIEKVQAGQPLTENDIKTSIWNRTDLKMEQKQDIITNLSKLMTAAPLMENADKIYENQVGKTADLMMGNAGGSNPVGASVMDPTLRTRSYAAFKTEMMNGWKSLIAQNKPLTYGPDYDELVKKALAASTAILSDYRTNLGNLSSDIGNQTIIDLQ